MCDAFGRSAPALSSTELCHMLIIGWILVERATCGWMLNWGSDCPYGDLTEYRSGIGASARCSGDSDPVLGTSARRGKRANLRTRRTRCLELETNAPETGRRPHWMETDDPCLAQISATGVPSSPCFTTNAFWASVNFDALMANPLVQPKITTAKNSNSEWPKSPVDEQRRIPLH